MEWNEIYFRMRAFVEKRIRVPFLWTVHDIYKHSKHVERRLFRRNMSCVVYQSCLGLKRVTRNTKSRAWNVEPILEDTLSSRAAKRFVHVKKTAPQRSVCICSQAAFSIRTPM